MGRKKFFYYNIYLLLSRNWITRRYIEKIRHIYEIIKPTDEITIISDTIQLALKSSFFTLVVLLFSISFRGTTIYNYLIIFSLIFIFHHQILQIHLSKEESKLLHQLEKYLADVRHYYHNSKMVEEAVYSSMEEAEYEISLHIHRIYEILILDDWEEVEKYKEIVPNKFLMTFLALCQVTIAYGDTIREGNSVFLMNLNQLKQEVNVEILKRERIQYVFSGLIFITLLPVFFLKAIENWGISNLPELEKYYYGAYGILVSISIFLITIFTYHIISRLKDQQDFFLSKEHFLLKKISEFPIIKNLINKYLFYRPSKVKKLDYLLKLVAEGMNVPLFIVQKIILFLFVFMFSLFLSVQVIVITKDNCFNYTKDYQGFSATSSVEELEIDRKIIKDAGRQWKKIKKKAIPKRKKIERAIEKNYKLENERVYYLAKEIEKRMQKYIQVTYCFYYPILAFLAAVIISNFPLIIAKCKKYFLKMNMEDEVMQFQSIIIMLMYIKRMNVETILQWMENFSEIFKSSIMECVDQFSYDEELALEQLKEKEPFLPFVRIIENLEVCDKVGVEQAFDEIVGERSYFAEKRKQENEINITNKGVIGKVIAYIPLVFTMVFYLIVPFVLESISQLFQYVNQMKAM